MNTTHYFPSPESMTYQFGMSAMMSSVGAKYSFILEGVSDYVSGSMTGASENVLRGYQAVYDTIQPVVLATTITAGNFVTDVAKPAIINTATEFNDFVNDLGPGMWILSGIVLVQLSIMYSLYSRICKLESSIAPPPVPQTPAPSLRMVPQIPDPIVKVIVDDPMAISEEGNDDSSEEDEDESTEQDEDESTEEDDEDKDPTWEPEESEE